jgi:NADPH:quinone reductase-like Zn-dependent oxidoreductase
VLACAAARGGPRGAVLLPGAGVAVGSALYSERMLQARGYETAVHGGGSVRELAEWCHALGGDVGDD